MENFISVSSLDEVNRNSATHFKKNEPTNPSGLIVKWAKHLDEVRLAQRLRHDVFCVEMGARLMSALDGHDIDEFDDYCEHLLVTPATSDQVIGTYRLLTPMAAKRMGRLYTEQEFELFGTESIRDRMVELGRSCVHPDFRQGSVIMGLWGALATFMMNNHLDYMIGCASIPMLQNGITSLNHAKGVWQQIQASSQTTDVHRAVPKLALPLEPLDGNPLRVEVPALIKGYLRIGAKVMGPPAWDPDFNTADLPILMNWNELSPRYAKHFSQSHSPLRTNS